MTDKWIKEESWCNIGNVKLYTIFERRYGKMWTELCLEHNWKDPTVLEVIDFRDRTITEKWHSYLKDMDLTTQEEKPTGEHVMDPCSKMGQSRYWPRYISIPEELALKILALGELP